MDKVLSNEPFQKELHIAAYGTYERANNARVTYDQFCVDFAEYLIVSKAKGDKDFYFTVKDPVNLLRCFLKKYPDLVEVRHDYWHDFLGQSSIEHPSDVEGLLNVFTLYPKVCTPELINHTLVRPMRHIVSDLQVALIGRNSNITLPPRLIANFGVGVSPADISSSTPPLLTLEQGFALVQELADFLRNSLGDEPKRTRADSDVQVIPCGCSVS